MKKNLKTGFADRQRMNDIKSLHIFAITKRKNFAMFQVLGDAESKTNNSARRKHENIKETCC